MSLGIQLGRPGLYLAAPGRPAEGLAAVRLDEAGFVGVALRGPVDRATPVSSWAQYASTFGGMETTVSGRDRLLPYAVQAYFAQGGRRAWVVRVSPEAGAGVPSGEESTARFLLGGRADAALVAVDEGAWGSGLVVELAFRVITTVAAGVVGVTGLLLPGGADVVAGSLLRIRSGAAPLGLLRWVVGVPTAARPLGPVELDEPLPETTVEAARVTVDVVTGTVVVRDPSGVGRTEQFDHVGLHPLHPRFLPTAVAEGSELVRADGMHRACRQSGEPWGTPLRPRPNLEAWTSTRVRAGLDRSDAVGWDSFFDPGGATSDLLDERPHRGVDLVGREGDLGLLSVPDLTWRRLPVPDQQPSEVIRATPLVRREDCCCGPAPEQPEPPVQAEAPWRPWLDGTDDEDLAEIVARQQRVVAVAEARRRFVALLDVPTGLPTARLTEWRAAFDSTYAAAYHPWLGVTRPGDTARGTAVLVPPSAFAAGITAERERRLGLARGTAVLVPPSAFAAGITAERERRLGLARGPANQLALGAVRVADAVDDPLAGRLHQLSLNVFAAERDGFRLSSARTLSLGQDYRQLSVRRLMTMLELTLQRYGEDLLVFEPNTSLLRARLTNAVTDLLRDLHRRGAFSGATEEESFFVRCDETTNPRQSQDLGRLVAEVGVAPSSPLEYLVLRIASDGDGRLLVDELARTGAVTGSVGPEVSLV